MYALGTCLAQKHDYVWLFGYNSHLGFPDVEGITMNFNEMPVSVSYSPRQMSLGSSNASICDAEGNLLFYTNGCYIANADNELMENGDGLNPGEVHDFQCMQNYTAGAQSCLILPEPYNPNRYYLFHKKIRYEYTPELIVISDNLLLTIIDMTLNSGAGAVIEKNQPLTQEPTVFGQLTSVKHANGVDWWIIIPKAESNVYIQFLLTSNGIEGPFYQSIGSQCSFIGSGGGQAVFSPNGSKYIRYSSPDGLYIFDFNRTTGILSNFIHVPFDTTFAEGLAVSPNSKYLYVSTDTIIYQLDLLSNNIQSSKTIIGTYDNFLSPLPTTFFLSRLAPDCKIYINTFATVDVLHVIHNPDEPGLACNLEQHAIQLPFNHRRSMPNFPNYRLGPLVPGETPAPPCELVVHTEEPPAEAEAQFLVYPNPASEHLTFAPAAPAVGSWQLFHADGRPALQQRLDGRSHEYRVAIGHLPPGMYFYRLLVDGQPGLGGKVSIIR